MQYWVNSKLKLLNKQFNSLIIGYNRNEKIENYKKIIFLNAYNGVLKINIIIIKY